MSYINVCEKKKKQSHHFFCKAVQDFLFFSTCVLDIRSKLCITIFAEYILSLAGGDIFLSSHILLAQRDTYFQSW